MRYKCYPDGDTVALVVAASEILNLSVDQVLHAFGDFFVSYVQDNGYSNVLLCLGNNLRDWLSNLNTLHDHLQASYPRGFIAPVFWSQDDEENEGALLVQYYSRRGSLLVPLVVGLIKRIAITYFDVEIEMQQLQLQGETEDAKHTSWRITSKDPSLAHRLRGQQEDRQQQQTLQVSSQYDNAFLEGEKQAADLRTEEFVKRCFIDPKSELYHALTAENYKYLVEFWQSNKIDGQWCYDKWSMDADDSSYPKLKDLPARLNTMICPHLNQACPQTGKYPPDEYGNLQSFQFSAGSKENMPIGGSDGSVNSPILLCPHLNRGDDGSSSMQNTFFTFRIMNTSTGLTKDILIDINKEMSLEQAVSENAPYLMNDWSAADEQAVQRDECQKQCVVWDDDTNQEFHSFSLTELKDTTTRQLTELFAFEMQDPIKLIFKCVEFIPVGEDEEDI